MYISFAKMRLKSSLRSKSYYFNTDNQMITFTPWIISLFNLWPPLAFWPRMVGTTTNWLLPRKGAKHKRQNQSQNVRKQGHGNSVSNSSIFQIEPMINNILSKMKILFYSIFLYTHSLPSVIKQGRFLCCGGSCCRTNFFFKKYDMFIRSPVANQKIH